METSNWKRAATNGDDALKNDHAAELDHLQDSNSRRLNQARSRIVEYVVDQQSLVVEVRHA